MMRQKRPDAVYGLFNEVDRRYVSLGLIDQNIYEYKFASFTQDKKTEDRNEHIESFDPIKEGPTYKVGISYEGRILHIVDNYVYSIAAAKQWLMEAVKPIMDYIDRDGGDSDLSLEYYETFMKCVLELKENMVIYVEGEFVIYIFRSPLADE